MTYPSSPGADNPRQPGPEGDVPSADPTYPPTQAYPYQPYQPGNTYQAANPYQQPYAYGYSDPYGQMGYPAPRSTEGLAIASLVVSCVGVLGLCAYGFGGLLGIVGAILGHVARGRIRRSGAEGDGMALAGIIVGWIAAAVGILIIVVMIVAVVFVSSAETSTATT